MTPATPVRADGSFSRAERFAVRYADALVRYRVHFRGRFSDGAVAGDLRMRARVYDRRGRRLRTTCDTRTRAWSAALAGPAGGSAASGTAPAPGGTAGGSAGTSTTGTSTGTGTGTTTGGGSTGTTEGPRRAVPGAWSFSATSGPRSYLGLGQSYSYGPPADQIEAYGSPTEAAFAIHPGDPEKDDWSAGFWAPDGDTLQAGRTYTDSSSYTKEPGSASMAMSAGSRACEGLGSFTVDALAFDPDGTLRRAVIRFQFRCLGDEDWVRGTWDFSAA